MIVVVIIGVLSVIAIAAYQQNTKTARNAEAINFLGTVRAAQESYFNAFGQYAGDQANWAACPNAGVVPNPTTGKQDWDLQGCGNNFSNVAWQQLGVRSPGNVWFQYRFRGGPVGTCPADICLPAQQGRPWYWAQARGDFDGDGTFSTFEVTSNTTGVFIENENE